MQIYTSNFLVGAFAGLHGQAYRQGDGFTMETQHYPDTPHHDNFPSTILTPEEEHKTSTVFRFGTRWWWPGDRDGRGHDRGHSGNHGHH